MTSKVVPVRLSEREIRLIDTLIELGVYKTRSEAVRDLVCLGLRSLRELEEVERIASMLMELEKRLGKMPLDLRGAARELLEERQCELR